MKNSTRWYALAITWFVFSSAFAAGAQRTFVASTGNDSHACSLTQPCRTFAAAIAQVLPGGEVVVLDSAGYGPVTITQSVTVTSAPGAYAGVSVLAGDGIAVDGSAITVTLRNLAIKGLGGNFGIHFVNGATLHVENCEISGFSGTGHSGVRLDAPGGRIFVVDTIIRDNENGVIVGELLHQDSGSLTVSRTRIENNATEGVFALGAAQIAIEDSVVAGSQYNVDAFPVTGASEVRMSVARTLVQRGAYGVYAEPNGTSTTVHVSIADSTLVGQTVCGVCVTTLNGFGFTNAYVSRSHVMVDASAGQPEAIFATGDAAVVVLDNVTAVGGPTGDVFAQNNGIVYSRGNNTIFQPFVTATGGTAEVITGR